jgi:hypothetical protein
VTTLHAMRDVEAALARNEAAGANDSDDEADAASDAEEKDENDDDDDNELVVMECEAEPPGAPPLPGCKLRVAPPLAPVATQLAPDWLRPGALCAAWRRQHACRGCAQLRRALGRDEARG